MAAYLVVNGTATAATDINAGGTDVPAYSSLDAVTLTDTELGVWLATAGRAAMKSAPTSTQRHFARKVLGIGQNPGV